MNNMVHDNDNEICEIFLGLIIWYNDDDDIWLLFFDTKNIDAYNNK